MRFVQGKSN